MEKESLLAIKVVGKRKVCYSAFHVDFKIDILSSSDRYDRHVTGSDVRNGYRRCFMRNETFLVVTRTGYFLLVTCNVNRKKNIY